MAAEEPQPPRTAKELKSTIKIQPAVGIPGVLAGPKPHVDSPFVQHLITTGKPNWKLATPEMKTKYRAYQKILIGIPVLFICSYVLVRRLNGESTKQMQKGEIAEDGTLIYWDENKIMEVERNTWSYKLFGPDYFQEGRTSRTIGKPLAIKPDDDD
ncbi:uncharacterized protein SPAPADRAFT_51142 [Spathaspora passalidarum NRRL Y-27907]|uniref:Uncharacterized protein n=1 Tax=Spathaspora passalidarum (strain NRRL Y-27907 / 11-Y1) TaxID=619300 RepID=G3ANX6_SPAPN|nr:uncharacterized protein SPAPADRAFT_51142 [Spathaspora passalidarum NRRL Y-27907]EGW32601.1 hypothetical protein SPAPADRAFT_51142 [Spathaspora passalidarum NRRL Y-27907]